MFRALRELGEGRWTRTGLGMRVGDRLRLFEMPFDVPLTEARSSPVWAENIEVSFAIERMEEVLVPWLAPLGLDTAEPINLIALYRDIPIIGIAGLLVSSNGVDMRAGADVDDEDGVWIIPVPDQNGRIRRWQARSLAEAIRELDEVEIREVEEIVMILGLTLVDHSS